MNGAQSAILDIIAQLSYVLLYLFDFTLLFKSFFLEARSPQFFIHFLFTIIPLVVCSYYKLNYTVSWSRILIQPSDSTKVEKWSPSCMHMDFAWLFLLTGYCKTWSPLFVICFYFCFLLFLSHLWRLRHARYVYTSAPHLLTTKCGTE